MYRTVREKGLCIARRWSRGVATEARMKELGIEIPEVVKPKGNYVSFVRVGNMAYLAGHLPMGPDGNLRTGRVGADLEVEDGYEAARYCGLQLLGTMKAYLGDLDKVKRMVRVGGFVQCTEEFSKQANVLNGCSDLLGEVFQENGVHVRTAVGTSALPLDVAVEVDCIIEIDDSAA